MGRSAVDVIVVGAGPGGLFAAERLARRGVRVLVSEEHQSIGDPVHCAGVLSVESFDEFDLPVEARLNALGAARLVSPSGVTVAYSSPSPVATVIDRLVFDRALADRATAAGADLRVGKRVAGVEIGVEGAAITIGRDTFHTRLVLLACGANYALQRRLGLGLPRKYLHSAQCELPAARLSDVELYFGRTVAPDGFAWAVPVVRPAGTFVRVGVMTSHDPVGCYTRVLARIAARWGVSDLTPRPRQKILPLGAIERTYGPRLLVIGDAAGLVKPTTGGGIHYSLLSAVLASDVAIEALAEDRLNAEALAVYEHRWRGLLADEFDAQHALRDVVTRLSDEAIDDFFDLANTDGIMPIVRATARFNRHRDLVAALFKHPPARRILFRAMAG